MNDEEDAFDTPDEEGCTCAPFEIERHTCPQKEACAFLHDDPDYAYRTCECCPFCQHQCWMDS